MWNMNLSQISYGRFFANRKGNCEVDLFLMQADGKKIVDPNKQNALCSRLRMELLRPVRLAVVSRGPDTELLVANPVELSGRGRPLVFHDITLALKTLNTRIFSVPFFFLSLSAHMILSKIISQFMRSFIFSGRDRETHDSRSGMGSLQNTTRWRGWFTCVPEQDWGGC